MKALIIFFLLVTTNVLAQTNVSGIVNNYYSVTAIDIQTYTLSLPNTAGINVNDTLLLIQMQGAQIDQSNSNSYGDILDYNGAGNYELVVICEVTSSSVRLKTQLLNDFQIGGLQLVSIPQDNIININGNLSCSPWNGSEGGVVALYGKTNINMNADIDVSGLGFRSGAHFYANTNCNVFSNFDDFEYDLSSNLGAQKGEGIIAWHNLSYGKGANANGGGGGNDHNSGGAGGSNVTLGGNGGDNDDPGTFRCKGYHPGIGGKALDYNQGKVFMGGAGGCGHSNSSPSAYQAGNGGGIVILITEELITNGHQISSNGTDGETGIGDGGAGGGAGGSVLLIADNITGNISVSATGGNGGNGDGAISVTNVNTDRCFGPGGGGSGGLIWLKNGTAPGGFSASLSGGNNGVVSGSSHTPCLGLAQGAENGEDGILDFGATIEISNKINNYCSNVSFDLGPDTTICNNSPIIINSPIQGSYSWSTGSTTNSINVSNSGVYALMVDDGTYLYCDSLIVTAIEYPVFSLGGTQYICNGGILNLNAPAGYADYLWSTGETGTSIEVTQTGIYSVIVGPEFCQNEDSVTVESADLDPIFTEEEVQLCSYNEIELDAGPSASTYEWSTGSNSRSITINEIGAYSVLLTYSNGCIQSDTINVVICESELEIPNTITPNGDLENDSWIIEDIFGYPDNQISIYDRSGRVVFEMTNYDNSWDGVGLPETVYYYVIDLNNGSKPLAGTITILR